VNFIVLGHVLESVGLWLPLTVIFCTLAVFALRARRAD
jgi:hypothetical protein